MTFLSCLYFHDQRIFIKRKMVLSVKCEVLIGRASGRSARVRGQDILKKTQSMWEKSRPPSQNWTSNQAPLSPQKQSRDKYHQLVLTWELLAKYRELTTILPAHPDPPLALSDLYRKSVSQCLVSRASMPNHYLLLLFINILCTSSCPSSCPPSAHTSRLTAPPAREICNVAISPVICSIGRVPDWRGGSRPRDRREDRDQANPNPRPGWGDRPSPAVNKYSWHRPMENIGIFIINKLSEDSYIFPTLITARNKTINIHSLRPSLSFTPLSSLSSKTNESKSANINWDLIILTDTEIYWIQLIRAALRNEHLVKSLNPNYLQSKAKRR